MEELYIDVSTNLLYDIRLRIEGAVDLYETEALCLKRLAVDNDMLDAGCAFDTIPIIERCSPGPFIELFARGDREGWAMWGNQATSDYEPTWNTYKNHTEAQKADAE